MTFWLSAWLAAAPAWGLYPAEPRAGASASEFTVGEFGSLLQRFVDALHQKAFRHLGDERDFDHGHLLFGPRHNRPVAILYHTQELAHYLSGSKDFGYLDPGGRNWIQWIDGGGIEKADSYERISYPPTAHWAWFQERELPDLRRHHTILDKMLDPDRLGTPIARTRQWVFSKVACGQAREAPEAEISIRLPDGASRLGRGRDREMERGIQEIGQGDDRQIRPAQRVHQQSAGLA
ncbi:MAG: hypothetical protein HY549_10460 [Elusimicrobia bacterium]|nr:hypothetical protein [Elusimicrobiota bacterium]